MKNIFIGLMLLSGLIFGQSNNWGTAFDLGPTLNSAGTKIQGATRDSILADTLYTPRMDMGDEYINGVYRITFQCDSVNARLDSISVDVRYWFKAQDSYGLWINLTALWKSDTLQYLDIAQSDSSWWGPANGRQYRLYRVSETADTAISVELSDYLGRFSQ